jgi:hypothetical protein
VKVGAELLLCLPGVGEGGVNTLNNVGHMTVILASQGKSPEETLLRGYEDYVLQQSQGKE